MADFYSLLYWQAGRQPKLCLSQLNIIMTNRMGNEHVTMGITRDLYKNVMHSCLRGIL